MKYYRRNKRQDSPCNDTAQWAMFIQGEDVDRIHSYGPYLWEATDEGAMDAADLAKLIHEVIQRTPQQALEDCGVDWLSTLSVDAIEGIINPSDILESADGWDCVELCNFLYEYMDHLMPDKIRTKDGLIVWANFEDHCTRIE